jgi:hypothetical protein
MWIIERRKISREYTDDFTGPEGHALLLDQDVNAIEYAFCFIEKLLETGEVLKA